MEGNVFHDFRNIVSNTLCPYTGGKLIYGPSWSDEVSFQENIRLNAIELSRFLSHFKEGKLHGFVMELKCPEGQTDLKQFAAFFHKTLLTLSSFDPRKSTCLNQEKENTEWQYEYCGVRMFIASFAPCYSTLHPRYSYSSEFAFLLIQPEESFSFCGVSSKNQQAKDLARKKFIEAGRPYDSDLIDKRIEAWLYILPEEICDQPIEWWDL